MNNQSYLKSAPLFSWPQVSPIPAPLDFGRLGGFAHKENRKNKFYCQFMSKVSARMIISFL